MIRAEEIFDLAASIESVYAAICDVGEIGWVVAGVQQVTAVDDNESDWKVMVRAGMVSQTLHLHGIITTRDPPHGLTFKAEGRNVTLTGSVALTALDHDMTRCHVIAEGEVTGRLAPLINLISRTTQKQLISETIANFKKKLSGG